MLEAIRQRNERKPQATKAVAWRLLAVCCSSGQPRARPAVGRQSSSSLVSRFSSAASPSRLVLADTHHRFTTDEVDRKANELAARIARRKLLRLASGGDINFIPFLSCSHPFVLYRPWAVLRVHCGMQQLSNCCRKFRTAS